MVTSKNPFQIGCADGIFIFQIMFSYSQMMGAVSTALIRSRHIHSSLIFLFLKKHMLLQNLRLDLNLVCTVRHREIRLFRPDIPLDQIHHPEISCFPIHEKDQAA